jgi:flap endonuclease-1
MGIKGLDKFIRDNTNHTIKHENMSVIYNKTVIVDTSCLVYRYILHSEDKFMQIFKNILRKMEKYRIKPIFVFDGYAPEEKQNIIAKRKEKAVNASCELDSLIKDKLLINNLSNDEEISATILDKYIPCSSSINLLDTKNCVNKVIEDRINKAKKKSMQLKSGHITQLKSYLDNKKISYIHTDIEADLVCAVFVKYGLVDYCISDDTDMFPYNCNYVIRNINFRDETLDIYNKTSLLEELNITDKQFIDLCILLGSDYIPRTIGIKPSNILYLIKKYHSIENIISNINEINDDDLITKKIYMNQMIKYNNIRNIFNDTIDISDIINDVNIYCSSITNKLITCY